MERLDPSVGGATASRGGWVIGLVLAVPVGTLALPGIATLARADLPGVVYPAANPFSESKRTLGRILFFDEQLSTDGTTSCATCHSFAHAGADGRDPARHPGSDGVFNTADDRFGSPGIIRSGPGNAFTPDPSFGLERQVTFRAARPIVNVGLDGADLFWDGAARNRFVDPETGEVVIDNSGALESQAVLPPRNEVEMAHAGFGWAEITAWLAAVAPLELATDLTPDMAAALAASPTYPDLFAAAFGDPAINARRIALALATYQRPLVSDQTPSDAWRAGDADAMTPRQVEGLNEFIASQCHICHTVDNDVFSDRSFRNIGLRPAAEDPGLPSDAGCFKTPGLRNVALKRTYMHNGVFTELLHVLRLSNRDPRAPEMFFDNLDPVVFSVSVRVSAEEPIIDVLTNALTDPRVAGETFPFDRPTLFTDHPELATVIAGNGVPGTGGMSPAIIASMPARLGSTDFRIGLDRALASARATLGVSLEAPVAGVVEPTLMAGEVTVDSTGVATLTWPLDAGLLDEGDRVCAQWAVEDPSAADGIARSPVAEIPVFCGRSGCTRVPCPADLTGDAILDVFDIIAFFSLFGAGDPSADLSGDGTSDIFDIIGYFTSFGAGC